MIMFEVSVIVVRWLVSRMFSKRVVGRARRGAGDIVLALSARRRRADEPQKTQPWGHKEPSGLLAIRAAATPVVSKTPRPP